VEDHVDDDDVGNSDDGSLSFFLLVFIRISCYQDGGSELKLHDDSKEEGTMMMMIMMMMMMMMMMAEIYVVLRLTST
jgi:hypothetical protein